MSDSRKESRPLVARLFIIPKGLQPKIDAIRRLTRDIARIAAHLHRDPRHWRGRQTLKSLELKHEQRAAALAALNEQAPEKHQALVQELKLVERSQT